MSDRTAARFALAVERLLPIVLAVVALGGLVVTLSVWIPHLRVLWSERVDEVEGLHPGLVLADSLSLADVWEVGGGLLMTGRGARSGPAYLAVLGRRPVRFPFGHASIM